MNNYQSFLKNELDKNAKHRNKLYCRDYLFTNASNISYECYPFYGRWVLNRIGNYTLATHPLAHVFVRIRNNYQIALVGHALNPFTGEIDENRILDHMLDALQNGQEAFLDELDQLTGVFVLFIVVGDSFQAVQDCGGQKMLYFGEINHHIVVSSAPQLAGDVFSLAVDPQVLRLLDSKGYYRGSGFLPGNLSPFKELKRLGPNTSVVYQNGSFSIGRVFPRHERRCLSNDAEKQRLIQIIHEIFQQNIALSMKKWDRVSLSLTGGIDSQTTFANAKPWWNDLFCFSFISKPSEKDDAEAASEICSKLGVIHHMYYIPQSPAEIEDYDLLSKIIEQNTSNTCKINPNEKRKYIWLERQNDFDVELKSDMSEVGRAYTERKYKGVRIPQKMKPRHLTINQARYFMEPWCMRFADKAYRSFMEETGLTGDILGYSMHDLVSWEVRMGAWASTSFSSQEYIHEITIPYNNRLLLEMFLRFPENERKLDLPHKMLMASGSKELADMQVRVKDSYLGSKRMLAETLYYYYATRLNLIR